MTSMACIIGVYVGCETLNPRAVKHRGDKEETRDPISIVITNAAYIPLIPSTIPSPCLPKNVTHTTLQYHSPTATKNRVRTFCTSSSGFIRVVDSEPHFFLRSSVRLVYPDGLSIFMPRQEPGASRAIKVAVPFMCVFIVQ
jgi:hypothetical protein